MERAVEELELEERRQEQQQQQTEGRRTDRRRQEEEVWEEEGRRRAVYAQAEQALQGYKAAMEDEGEDDKGGRIFPAVAQ